MKKPQSKSTSPKSGGKSPKQKASASGSDSPRPIENSGYWLFKSEPDVFSIDDLKANKTTFWEGVRNYQARNLLRDTIQKGDLVLYYHSNAEPSGVAGIARVCKTGYPDHTAFDPRAHYYDEKSDPDNPTWYMVDVEFVDKFDELISLHKLKETPGLEDMMVTKRGARLSIQPVTKDEWNIILKLAGKKLK
ncbi:MAG: EVE domain-containing protein [Cyanobacteria bacterium]|nr:EVE domain-containing protein [Cyanobacteriota bacterium]